MYVYIHIYIFTQTHVNGQARARPNPHTYTHTHAWKNSRIYTHTHLSAAYTRTYTRTHGRTYICIYIYIYSYKYKYTPGINSLGPPTQNFSLQARDDLNTCLPWEPFALVPDQNIPVAREDVPWQWLWHLEVCIFHDLDSTISRLSWRHVRLRQPWNPCKHGVWWLTSQESII